MSLLDLAGHHAQRDAIRRAVAADRLPQVLLITGAGGIGKQRFALWIAQVLFCTGAEPKPCGRCAGCRKVLDLGHPDLHWFVPVPRPKATEPSRQLDEIGELLESVMVERRREPLWSPPDGMAIHGIASARLLQRQAALTPVEGGWRVFIVGHAERLVPQEASQEAANALLKLLEEPPSRTLFVLTATEAGLVLPTIRSRATPMRLGRLSDAEVSEFFRTARPALATDAATQSAQGAIGRATAVVNGASGSGRDAARALLDQLRQGPTATALVLRQGPWQARGDFTELLDGLAAELASRARRATTGSSRVPPSSAIGNLDGIECVLRARERAQGNINPQLLLAGLIDELLASGVA
jgi:DNA polymerase-3 subunit delta'